ncbi:NAD(P)H-dependent oxidoreductase [Candidatus Woesearchaeota archaeon]|jgi:NAD(P)H dehydrogenase (quinone)|nr:NAD(P)H-dependent oxidoreductase [Candidatus Woesearchaeota archaeon]MBT4367966.1 NAD(P)H-dependent oxidoreductase [Candidatus Woesearchaeota archaeon]MBT4712454.1 NAD(P)H-dependent oxidoreductase [Candidatus Woesearchaeota archaeon]MBT6639367.1 NAD(P)H-dependent oxidoreductase [Candidatus Woesearchaeota archaeon]MBT7133539.1 NAD(P)H-dependent oxidoreductase [Candidatus Woesearchaeota archaeon]
MKNLIIYAHPNKKGHNGFLLEQIKQRLTDYEVIDLYNMKYNPVLSDEELYSKKPFKINADTKSFQTKIKQATNLIFIYPLWWGTMPAILKGFFDKTFTTGFSYEFKNKMPKGLLKGKRASVFITTGAPKFLSIFMGRFKRHIKKDILQFCGIKTKVFPIGSCFVFNDKQKVKIQRLIRKVLKNG